MPRSVFRPANQDNKMKTFPNSSFRSGLNGLLKITVTLTAMTAVSACASLGSFSSKLIHRFPLKSFMPDRDESRAFALMKPPTAFT